MKKKAKATHRIEFHSWRPSTGRLWNWRVRAANGEVIAYSNQGHARKRDARAAICNFIAAAKAGKVEIQA